MDSNAFQPSSLDNPPECQCYCIRIYRAAIWPDENEIINVYTNAKLNPQ